MARIAGTDDLTQLAHRIIELAAEHGLALVPVLPLSRTCPVVELWDKDMTVEAFLELAVAAGSKLAYLQTETFDSEEFGELVPAETDQGQLNHDPLDRDFQAAAAAFRSQALERAGQPCAQEVAFVSQGVVHRWTAEALWYQQLRQDAEELDARAPGDQVAGLSQSPEETLVARLAAELVALPEFRAAKVRREQQRIAQTHYAETQQDGHLIREGVRVPLWRVVDQAQQIAMQERQRHYHDAEQRIAEWVRQLADDPSYRSASTAPARKHRARDFLAAQADGYAAPGRVFDLLWDALASHRAAPDNAPTLPL